MGLLGDMRLYLDIETYRPKSAFVNEKVIAIGLIADQTDYKPESSNIWDLPKVEFKYFKEWKRDERSEEWEHDEYSVVTQFYKYLKELIEKWRRKEMYIEVVGFNILRFDIPLLIQKGVEHRVGSLEELNSLWHNTFTRDYLQMALPLNNMRFKGLQLEYLAEMLREKGVNVPKPYGKGEEVKSLYENKKYDEIIKHLEADLRITRIIDLNWPRLFKPTP
ncbi:hypothetical protein AB1303_13885 [Saccharolobus solfataricus]|nr:hypothetical protein [Saccharolobus solfataricus]QPG49178.1 hypothetical protein HFC64_04240 [Saccharolobus solfataricus]